MTAFAWLADFVTQLNGEHVMAKPLAADTLAPAQCLSLDRENWGTAARVAAAFGCRWAGIWGDHVEDTIRVHAGLAYRGDYLVLQTRVPLDQPVLPSHTPYYPAADKLERHLQDLFGIAMLDHPDAGRWTRHQAWPEGSYPLRKDFPLGGLAPKRSPADVDYPFVPILGNGVYEIPVGPVHAGIIEPGHFRFHAVGEEVVRLETRLGYVHKGIEKLAEDRNAAGLAHLAGRISGDSTVAHTWAACMALERAILVTPPARALAIRAVLAERERIANHLGDIGAICNDVGFAFAHAQFSHLRELWTRANHAHFGHRLLMDRIIPGGVLGDLDAQAMTALQTQHQQTLQAIQELCAIMDDHPSLEDRLVGTGVLSTDTARRLGVLGYLAKASGLDLDVRRDHAYAPYADLNVVSPCLAAGDVAARVQVRADEVRHSLDLLAQLLETLPAGPIQAAWPENVREGEGLGLVEGWRGEILSYVRMDSQGRVARFFARDPSWFSWPALEQLIYGNIVADFPVCNKSVNGSYSGHDL